MNSGILKLKTLLIKLEIIQLVKYLLKKDLNTLNEIKNEGITKQKKTHSKTERIIKFIQ